jgi:hypothetical protein
VIGWAAPIVEWSTLGQVIGATLAVGIGVTIIFSLVIWGSVKASDHSRSGQRSLAAVHGVVAFLALALTLAVIVYGLHVLSTK